MEYLPEKKRTQQAQIRKKEQKLKDFRQYLADKEVILALVKRKYIFISSSYHLSSFYSLALCEDAEALARGSRQAHARLLRQLQGPNVGQDGRDQREHGSHEERHA